MFQATRQEGMIYRISAMAEQVDLDDRLLANDIHRFSEVHERTFFDKLALDPTFEDDFRLGRHF